MAVVFNAGMDSPQLNATAASQHFANMEGKSDYTISRKVTCRVGLRKTLLTDLINRSNLKAWLLVMIF